MGKFCAVPWQLPAWEGRHTAWDMQLVQSLMLPMGNTRDEQMFVA